jgi:hypothetical protein
MSDWEPLREHLLHSITAQVDAEIRHGADPELRRLLATYRALAIRMAVDYAELIALREAAAERAPSGLHVVATHGHA